MFSLNKTGEWLESKDTDEMRKYLTDAYTDVSKTRQ